MYTSIPHLEGPFKSSDIPWMAAATVGTFAGLILVLNQDLRHEYIEETEKRTPPYKVPGGQGMKRSEVAELSELGDDKVPEKVLKLRKKIEERDTQNGLDSSKLGQIAISKKEDPSAPGAGRPRRDQETGLKGHNPLAPPKAMGHGEERPDKSDQPDPNGKPKSFNEMSGKQEHWSNSDIGHSLPLDHQTHLSKKGEGVVDSAKLKGTVSTDRPQPENKEERGKPHMDKDE
ncbi:hypothetical protein ACN47E_006033 [Coniothyrium glycines]